MTGLTQDAAGRIARSHAAAAVVVGLSALISIGWNLPSEPFFADESAYYSQSYFFTVYTSGRFDDPVWLDYPGYDLPPLTKYLIGASLRSSGYKTTGPAQALAWYQPGNTGLRFDPPGGLTVARVPIVMVGALGCLAIYGIGVLAGGRAVGLLAALFLMANPLYRLHARRAMSDVPCEAFVLLGLFFALWAWGRRLSGRPAVVAWFSAGAGGVSAGLAVLSKLSGLLALIVMAVWAVLALASRVSAATRIGAGALMLVAAVTAPVVFVALDPYLTAHPTRTLAPASEAINRMSLLERARWMFRLRFEVSADQKVAFPHNALNTPAEKLAVSVVQGFGRFGPFGPTHSDSVKRFDPRQDLGALLWLPWVAAGVVWAALRGRAQVRAGLPPTAWAILAQFAAAFGVVTLYLPMAWDRYLLPIQAPAALLAAGVGVAAAGRVVRAAPNRLGVWVFVLLLGSYSYFWQARDWNSGSRLMLTYALVDRGTVSIDGLEDHTRDRAFLRGRYYTDKLPGFSLLGTVPYGLARMALRLPPHPLNVRGLGFAYWPADYWVTLGTSGLFTALTGVLLAHLARDLGCGPRRAALIALAYGLATPAYVYATLSYGHQASAFALLASYALIRRIGARRSSLYAFAAGFLAAYAAAIELHVGLVSAILGLYLLAQVVGGRRRLSTVGEFAVGALVPTLLLLGYNQLAFGSPLESGYFHLTTPEFARVHAGPHPLGLRRPDLGLVAPLLWGRFRGLLFYAPVVSLVPFGLVALAARRAWGVAIVSSAAMVAVFAVNLSYPAWTGGWTTGPRLLLPLLPFAMLPVAGLLAHWGRWATPAAVALTLAGGVTILLCVGVGGRLSQDVPDPLVQVVWPLWRGSTVPGWVGTPFTRNLGGLLAPGLVRRLPAGWKWLQFAPLVIAQGLAVVLLTRSTRGGPARDRGERPRSTTPSDLRVDQQQDDGREHEETQNPGAEPQRVGPDPGPGLVPGCGVNQADRGDQGQDKPVDVDAAEDVPHARASGPRLSIGDTGTAGVAARGGGAEVTAAEGSASSSGA